MRKSPFKNLPIGATFTYKGIPLKKASSIRAIRLDDNHLVYFFKPDTTVNYHKSKPLDVSHSSSEQQ